MPRKRIPSYCHHKPTGQAYVRIDGTFHYLGEYDSDESHQAYDAMISKWLEKTEVEASDLALSQVLNLFWKYCKKRYGNYGRGPHGNAVNWRPIMKLRP